MNIKKIAVSLLVSAFFVPVADARLMSVTHSGYAEHVPYFEKIKGTNPNGAEFEVTKYFCIWSTCYANVTKTKEAVVVDLGTKKSPYSDDHLQEAKDLGISPDELQKLKDEDAAFDKLINDIARKRREQEVEDAKLRGGSSGGGSSGGGSSGGGSSGGGSSGGGSSGGGSSGGGSSGGGSSGGGSSGGGSSGGGSSGGGSSGGGSSGGGSSGGGSSGGGSSGGGSSGGGSSGGGSSGGSSGGDSGAGGSSGGGGGLTNGGQKDAIDVVWAACYSTTCKYGDTPESACSGSFGDGLTASLSDNGSCIGTDGRNKWLWSVSIRKATFKKDGHCDDGFQKYSDGGSGAFSVVCTVKPNPKHEKAVVQSISASDAVISALSGIKNTLDDIRNKLSGGSSGGGSSGGGSSGGGSSGGGSSGGGSSGGGSSDAGSSGGGSSGGGSSGGGSTDAGSSGGGSSGGGSSGGQGGGQKGAGGSAPSAPADADGKGGAKDGKGGGKDGKGEGEGESEEAGKCKYLPDWLCGETSSGGESADFSQIGGAIKKHDVSDGFKKEDVLSSSGVCPKPLTARVGLASLSISFDFVCDFLSKIRPVVIAIFLMMSATVIVRSFD